MNIDKDWLLVLRSSELIEGEPDLGYKLNGSFIKVISESGILPARMVFLGSGIFLTTEGSPVQEELRAVEGKGCEIVSCITCLNYYDRMDKLAIGRPGDMKDTVDSLRDFKKVTIF